jgi:hypothetical protein
MGLGATASRIRAFLSRAARFKTWPSLRLSIVSRLSIAVGAVLILALSANLLLDQGMRILRVRDPATVGRAAGASGAAGSRSFPIARGGASRDTSGAALAQLAENLERQRTASDALIAALNNYESTSQSRAASGDEGVVAQWHSAADALDHASNAYLAAAGAR